MWMGGGGGREGGGKGGKGEWWKEEEGGERGRGNKENVRRASRADSLCYDMSLLPTTRGLSG